MGGVMEIIDNKDVEHKEKMRGQEIMRLNILARDLSADKLLDAALAGRDKSKESVTKLYSFVVKAFGYGAATNKYWDACFEVLSATGMTDEQLNAVRNPFPKAGSPGFRSILDEMHDEGRD
jgi:hypothetical protein